MDCQIISTGSKGNAVLLNGQVLIDCGVPYSKLAETGVVDDIRYVFLTHQHKDHLNVATLRKLIQNHPLIKLIYPIYLCKPLTDFCCAFDNSFFINNSFIVSPNKWYAVSNIQFSSVPLRHDVPNVGWKLHFSIPQGIYKVFYATDTVSLDGICAKNYNLYLVEANYSKAEIIERIKEKRANGQYVYEERVLKTHLSKEKCDEFIYNNIGNNGCYAYLHGHEETEDSE